MKKILCFLLVVIMCFSLVSLSAYAIEASEETTEKMYLNAVAFTCMYNVKENRVVIDGSVSHDFMISHGDYKMKIYSIMPGHTFEEIIANPDTKPHAESDMTMKFTFSINVESILDRYSKYAIVLCSPSGETHLAGQPTLPSISSDFEYDSNDRTHFKGVLTDNPVDIGYSGAGTVIVDVDVAKTIGDAADSILYPMGDSYIHIRKSYITHIDKQIKSASISGSRVYIRLLLSANNRELAATYSEKPNKYAIPKLYSEEVLERVFTITSFLANRYNGEKGTISGMIPGTRIDDTTVNSTGGWSVDEYAERYTLCLVLVGNALRSVRPDLDIVIPLSDRNDYSSEEYAKDNIRPSQLLEKIIYMLDENVSGEFNCSVMIESSDTPIEVITKNDKHTFKAKNSAKHISADNINVFTAYLSNLGKSYMSVPSNIIFLWNPEAGLRPNELAASYIYTYSKLVQNSQVSSFAIKLDKQSFDGMRNVLRNIDTDKAEKTNLPIAEYFGYSSWTEVLKSSFALPVSRIAFNTDLTLSRPAGIVGEFQYMDFTTSEIYSLMSAGHNCTYLRSDYNAHGARALSVMSTAVSLGDSLEALGKFEYPESYEYTPYMSITAQINDEKSRHDALYEITVTLGMGNAGISAVGIIENGEEQTLFFDVSEFSNVSMADYIRVSARPLTDDSEGFSLILTDIKGYSTEHGNEELSRLIGEKRLQIRNQSADDGGGFNYTMLMTIIGIVFAMAAVAVGLIVVFKRDEDTDKKDSQD